MNQFGKANLVKTDGKNGRKTTFADVAGADEEKEELKEIVDFLKHPKKFNELGARIPKGVLLMGPPVLVKPCWPVRLQVKRAFRSSRFPVRIS